MPATSTTTSKPPATMTTIQSENKTGNYNENRIELSPTREQRSFSLTTNHKPSVLERFQIECASIDTLYDERKIGPMVPVWYIASGIVTMTSLMVSITLCISGRRCKHQHATITSLAPALPAPPAEFTQPQTSSEV